MLIPLGFLFVHTHVPVAVQSLFEKAVAIANVVSLAILNAEDGTLDVLFKGGGTIMHRREIAATL